MSDMSLGKYKAAIAYACSACSTDTAVYDHILAYHIVVSDIAVGLLAFPTEVLRICSDDCALIHFVVAPHTCAGQDAGVWLDLAAIADLYVSVNVCERMDCDILANLGRGVDMG